MFTCLCRLWKVKSDRYTCSRCAIRGVKLWRQYRVFGEELFCVDCAELNQGKTFNECDRTIGWLVPAVPDDEGNYWGYTSMPTERISWWCSLPFRECTGV